MKKTVAGKIVDVWKKEIFEGSIEIEKGRIVCIHRHATSQPGYIIPGFVDAHVHIESSMLTPEHFGQLTIRCGTVAVVTDPHEIANVMGVQGIDFMIENSKRSPIKTFFSIPSCVPATPFDVSGGSISVADTQRMAASGRFVALSEMMNVPGVLSQDKDVMAKIDAAKKHGLPIDGHAPMLQQEALQTYIDNGIRTDHECVTLEEAQEKIKRGMKILLREGSAARNYEALKSLVQTHPNEVMFCTDDSHPDELLSVGHINKLVIRSVANGLDVFDVLKIASINPIRHYKLDVGQLRVGDKADFVVVENLKHFQVKQVYIEGIDRLQWQAPSPLKIRNINRFQHDKIEVTALQKAVTEPIKVISVIKGELLTLVGDYSPTQPTENLEGDPSNDLAKIVYLNRYTNGVPQVAFCKGFSIQKGAFASSISHDSHNIIAVGCNDNELAQAINALLEQKGGLSVCCDNEITVLPLPIGGIMSDAGGAEVARDYRHLCQTAHATGCTLDSPFMTLSFMSLVVIPEIKIGEKGLFCYSLFDWISPSAS
ncbi:MAG: adenine deaminase [Bacteroidaceae bacterium]